MSGTSGHTPASDDVKRKFREALEKHDVQRLYLTLVHADIAGDTHFPSIDPADWTERSREHHPANERHAHAFSFVVLDRR